jgi:glycerol-3-phosphate dehydrogenase
MLAPSLGSQRKSWTRDAFLPGGDLSQWIGTPKRPDTDIKRFTQALALRHEGIDAALLQRLARDYGSRVELVLKDGLGAAVAPNLHEAELRYLHDFEWARSADDVLWRRTKLGLHLSAEERDAVAQWCASNWDHNAAQTASARSARSEMTWN